MTDPHLTRRACATCGTTVFVDRDADVTLAVTCDDCEARAIVDAARRAKAQAEAADVLAAILADDTGDAPGCPFGRRAVDWAPVAAALAVVMADASGDPLRDPDGDIDLTHGSIADGAVSAVVNASDDVASILREHGSAFFDVADLLGDEFINPQWLADAEREGGDIGRAAGSWAADGNTSADYARRVLALLDDGDPAADDYLPPTPNLSGEWAGDYTPATLAFRITGWEDLPTFAVDAIADAWEAGVEAAFSESCERALRAHAGDARK